MKVFLGRVFDATVLLSHHTENVARTERLDQRDGWVTPYRKSHRRFGKENPRTEGEQRERTELGIGHGASLSNERKLMPFIAQSSGAPEVLQGGRFS